MTRTISYYPAAGAMRINSTLYYVLKDHLSSASVVTDASGNIVGEQRYYPFGETRFSTGSMFTDKLFTGQREMVGLGIYHFNARVYSPKLGRFLSPDTVVPGYANPQNLNRFSYVRNNPLRYIDPTGHWADEGCGCVNQHKTKSKGPKVIHGIRVGNSDGDGTIVAPPPSTPITDFMLQLPGSAEDWNNLATGLDTLAWLTDVYAAGAVTYAGFAGAALPAPLIAAGLPEVPLATGLTGMAIAELYIQPVLFAGNTLATLSMGATVVSDTKDGNTVIEEANFTSSVLNSLALTDIGWMSNEAYLSLTIQTISVTNDLQWTSLPFPVFP